MHSCYTYQVILHDCIVLGIVSESQTQILPRPTERAEVKFSLSYTFSFIFTMVSNRFVRECFVVVVFSNPCHFEKVQVGKDQEKAQSAKDSHSKSPRWDKNKLTIRYLYHENIS